MARKISKDSLAKRIDGGAKKVPVKTGPKPKKEPSEEERFERFQIMQIETLEAGLKSVVERMEKVAESVSSIEIGVPASPNVSVVEAPRPMIKTVHLVGLSRDAQNRIATVDFNINYEELH